MQFDTALDAFGHLHAQYGPMLDTLLLLFGRMLGFVSTGPIFNRKNIPFTVKLTGAIFFTITLFWVVAPGPHGLFTTQGAGGPYLMLLIVNILIGAFIGFIADTILQAAYAAGNLMNNQIGLSSATILDPATGKQAMILESLFAYLTILIFMYLGGVGWMVSALKRSLDLFPLYTLPANLTQQIDISYLSMISGNVLLIGVQLMAPVMIVTMTVDIMLGVVNRTAQQMPVFQLSFALKPAIGIAVMLLTLPIFLNVLQHFLTDFAQIF